MNTIKSFLILSLLATFALNETGFTQGIGNHRNRYEKNARSTLPFKTLWNSNRQLIQNWISSGGDLGLELNEQEKNSYANLMIQNLTKFKTPRFVFYPLSSFETVIGPNGKAVRKKVRKPCVINLDKKVFICDASLVFKNFMDDSAEAVTEEQKIELLIFVHHQYAVLSGLEPRKDENASMHISNQLRKHIFFTPQISLQTPNEAYLIIQGLRSYLKLLLQTPQTQQSIAGISFYLAKIILPQIHVIASTVKVQQCIDQNGYQTADVNKNVTNTMRCIANRFWFLP